MILELPKEFSVILFCSTNQIIEILILRNSWLWGHIELILVSLFSNVLWIDFPDINVSIYGDPYIPFVSKADPATDVIIVYLFAGCGFSGQNKTPGWKFSTGIYSKYWIEDFLFENHESGNEHLH